MKEEATKAGFYQSFEGGTLFPRLQILTIEDLLHGAEIKMPAITQTFKRAEAIRKDPNAEQNLLF